MPVSPPRIFVVLLSLGAAAIVGCGQREREVVVVTTAVTPAAASRTPGIQAGGPPIAQANPAEPEPPGLYGDAGEEVLAADPSVPDTLMRCRAGDTFYKLSNLKVDKNRFGMPTLFVDYDVVRLGQFHGVSLIIHGDDGHKQTVLILGPMNDSHGTLEIESRFPTFNRPAFPSNMEVYLTRQDPRYGPQTPTFKVSNSAIQGTMAHLTRPRNWTKEEIDRLSQPPPPPQPAPNFTTPNANPAAGEDTPFVGDTTGGINQRFVEAGGFLYGVEYRLGEWDKEPCIGGLVPIFKRAQPTTIPTRVLAKQGYAVGAFKVQSKKFVDAIQVVFFKIKPDGSLDKSDSYTTEWFGYPEKGEGKTLAGDGTRVIGINCRQGAILNGIALVTEKGPAGKS